MKNDEVKIRVGIAEDHQILRQSLVALLKTEEMLSVALEVGDGFELLEKIQDTSVDVLILDINMPRMDGEQCIPILRKSFPNLKIIILSAYYSEPLVNAMLKIGAHVYLPKHVDYPILLKAIESVHNLGSFEYVKKTPLVTPKIESDLRESFTARELEILKLVCEEKTSKEIAQLLFISHRTVEGHKMRLLEKTKSTNTSGIIIYALRNGLFR
jgi:DNA-binding NarL/FixJ family response regulator